jgi:hypothetical protein
MLTASDIESLSKKIVDNVWWCSRGFMEEEMGGLATLVEPMVWVYAEDVYRQDMDPLLSSLKRKNCSPASPPPPSYRYVKPGFSVGSESVIFRHGSGS